MRTIQAEKKIWMLVILHTLDTINITQLLSPSNITNIITIYNQQRITISNDDNINDRRYFSTSILLYYY